MVASPPRSEFRRVAVEPRRVHLSRGLFVAVRRRRRRSPPFDRAKPATIACACRVCVPLLLPTPPCRQCVQVRSAYRSRAGSAPRSASPEHPSARLHRSFRTRAPAGRARVVKAVACPCPSGSVSYRRRPVTGPGSFASLVRLLDRFVLSYIYGQRTTRPKAPKENGTDLSRRMRERAREGSRA